MQGLDQKDGWIWQNGEMVEWKQARVHVLTHGMHYASSVFEGIRVYDGNVFKLRAHNERLIKSAKLLDMDVPYSVEDLDAAARSVVHKNNIVNGYIRPVAWRGSEQMGIGAQQTKTHVAIAAWEWPSYFSPEARERGLSLQTSQWRKPDPQTAPTESKTAALYAINTLAKHAAENAGFDDALMLDYRGYVAESTGANLFMVKDGVLKTPIPDCFLNGITRQTIIALAKEHDIQVEVCVIMPDDLYNADEVFLTGTAAEITAIGKVDDVSYIVGPITRKLREAYEALVRLG